MLRLCVRMRICLYKCMLAYVLFSQHFLCDLLLDNNATWLLFIFQCNESILFQFRYCVASFPFHSKLFCFVPLVFSLNFIKYYSKYIYWLRLIRLEVMAYYRFFFHSVARRLCLIIIFFPFYLSTNNCFLS